MDFTDKAQSLAERMNKLSETFDLAEDMSLEGDDIIEYVEEKTTDVELFSEDLSSTEIINLSNMVDDFKYIRETLRETTQNGRRVLNVVTLDLLDSDDDKRAELIMSFAALNKAVGDNMKLYMQSYKDISATLINIDKMSEQKKPSTVNNNMNISVDAINTAELIQKLKQL